MKEAAAPVLRLLQLPRLAFAVDRTQPLERKDAALLALLAIDGPTQPGQAAALLWPDRDEPQARNNLRQRLFRLRKASGTEIVVANGALRLAPAIVVDVLQFATALLDDPQAGAGELLGSLDYGDTEALDTWVSAARQRWRDQRHERLAARASELEASQEIAAALVLAQRIVADEPLQEHAHRRVMRLHYLRGDSAAALTAYQECRDILRHELGAKPHRETDELATLVEAGGALRQPGPVAPAIATLRPPRLVGRDETWHRLQCACANAALVLIEGEAGIGKSRLLGDFASAHGNAPQVNGRPGDNGLPYALLARLVSLLNARYPPLAANWVRPELARLTPLFGMAAESPTSTLRLQQAVLQAFAEWQAAGLSLLVIDDLHYADAATLEMLPAIVAASHASGVAWLIGVRSGEVPAAAAPWLNADEAPVTNRIALGPLDVNGVRELLDSLLLPGLDAARWAPPLARHTGGNPLFLLETLIALLDEPSSATAGRLAAEPPALPAPERIGRLIERRLAQLSSAALNLARLAGIAGVDFSAQLATQALGLSALDIADLWRELERAGVIRDSAFAHDLVLEGVLRSIPQAVTRLLHRDVAKALEGAGAPAQRLAAHWEAAEEWLSAGHSYQAAAVSARAASRRVEEREFWHRAASCFTRGGDREHAFRARAESMEAAHVTCKATEVRRLTKELVDDAHNDRQRCDALVHYGESLLLNGCQDEGASVADQAMALAEALDDPWLRVRAAVLLMSALESGPRAAEAIDGARSLTAYVQINATVQHRLSFKSRLATALQSSGRLREAAAIYELAISEAQTAPEVVDVANPANNYATVLYQLGRLQEGRFWAEKSCGLLEQANHVDGLLPFTALNSLGVHDVALGRYDDALRELTSAAAKLATDAGSIQRIAVGTNLALAWLHLGQPSRAKHVLTPMDPKAASQAPVWLGRRQIVEARIFRHFNKPTIPVLQNALNLIDSSSGAWLQTYLHIIAELDLSRELEPALAVDTCRRLEGEARERELLAVAMRAKLMTVEALLRGSNWTQAGDMARQLVGEWHSCRPVDVYWPEALWIAYKALEGSGDATAALAVLAEAGAWINQTAAKHVPAPYQSGFLQRNAVNRRLLALVRGLPPLPGAEHGVESRTSFGGCCGMEASDSA